MQVVALNSRVAQLSKQLRDSQAREKALTAELEGAKRGGRALENGNIPRLVSLLFRMFVTKSRRVDLLLHCHNPTCKPLTIACSTFCRCQLLIK